MRGGVMSKGSIVEAVDPLGDDRQLLTDEPVEVHDFRRITHHFRGIYIICLTLIKKVGRYLHVSGWTWKH